MNNHQKISVLIGEDELLIAENLKDLCIEMGYHVVGIGTNRDEIIALLDKHAPDIALLDIRMNGRNQGIEAARYIRQTSGIPFIFITAFSDDETVAEAVETNPDTYLVKPYDRETVAANIKLSLLKNKILNKNDCPSIEVLTSAGKQLINTGSILYIRVLQNYCKIHLRSQVHITRMTINKMGTLLPDDSFIQIHKSFIVNVRHIRSTRANAVMIYNQTIPIGRTYKEKVDTLLSR